MNSFSASKDQRWIVHGYRPAREAVVHATPCGAASHFVSKRHGAFSGSAKAQTFRNGEEHDRARGN